MRIRYNNHGSRCWMALFVSLACGFVSVSCSGQTSTTKPIETLSIAALTSKAGNFPSARIAYLSENSLALGICRSVCSLTTFGIENGKLRQSATVDVPLFQVIFRAPNGGILLDHVWFEYPHGGGLMFSSDLQTAERMPELMLEPDQVASSGEIFGNAFDLKHWAIYQTERPSKLVRNGNGELLSVSDHAVAYREGSTVTIQALDGKILGSFQAGAHTDLYRIIAPNRLLVVTGLRYELLDFGGNRILKLNVPSGWNGGGVFRTPADGSRLLYDVGTRDRKLLHELRETGILIATAGMGLDDVTADGELVRVIDAATGKSCFELAEKTGLLPDFRAHADISPSGRTIAIVTMTQLSLYKLPAACSGR
jgi:hypothetical protein